MPGNITINPKKAGLSLGAVFAIWHLGWLAILAIGLGQMVLDWMYQMHFVQNGLQLTALEPVNALIGVVGAFVCGAITGVIFALIWNALPE